MPEHVVAFGMKFLDPNIPWPTEAEQTLSVRDGWIPEKVRLSTCKPEPVIVEAMCWGQFAVHKMVDDVGFAITCKANGLRLFSKGRVFARSDDAMAMVERLMTIWDGWTEFLDGKREAPDGVSTTFEAMHDEAERLGEIMKTVVYPA